MTVVDRWAPSDPENGFINYDAVKRSLNQMSHHQYVLARGISRVEVVNEFETWLLDDQGQRKRRICGVQHRKLPQGYVCQSVAGAGTAHLHFGKCVKHERTKLGTYRKLMERVAMAPRVEGSPTLVATQVHQMLQGIEISPEEFRSVDGDIEALYSLMGIVGNTRDLILTGGEWIKLTKDLVDSVIKAKKARMEMDITVNYIAKSDFVAFYRQLMELVIREMGRGRGSVFIEKINTLVIGYDKEAMRRLTYAPGVDVAVC